MTLWRRRMRYRFSHSAKKPRSVPLRRRRRRLFAFGCFLLLLIWIFLKTEIRIGDLAQQAAVSQLHGLITTEVNREAADIMSTLGSMPALCKEERDENGDIRTITTDYARVNRIKSELTIGVQAYLDTLDTVETTVPSGMLVSDTLLTGYGIKIPIRVFVTHAIQVDFEDEFTSAGINQTRHCLSVTVRVPARVAGVLTHQETEIVTQVPIAETILIGEVPQTYLNHNSGN